MIARSHLALAAIIVVAFALRVAWIAWIGFEPTLSDDAGRYDFLGRSLAGGGGFINPNGNVTLFWPPGYPFLLAAIYKAWPAALFGPREVTAALAVNAIAGAATCAFVYGMARRLAPSDRRESAGLAAASMFAVLPSAVFYTGVTLTETWFTFLLCLALWLIVVSRERGSWPLLALAGVVIGYAALVRGQALLLPLVAVPYWLASRCEAATRARPRVTRALLPAAITAAVAAAVVLPWTVRNYVHAGQPVALATNSGIDFYIGHSPGADGRGRIVDELVFRYPDLPPAEAEARVSRDGFREGLEYAFRHPLREVELTARKAFFLFWHDHEAVAWSDAHGERYVMADAMRNALAGLSDVYYYAVMLLASGGIAAWLAGRAWHRNATGVLLVSVLVYWVFVHVAFFGDPRFHAPIMPVVCAFAALGAVTVLGSMASRRRQASD